MAELRMKLKPVHYDIVAADTRYKVVIAGRRFNKTGMLIAAIAKHLTEPVFNVSTGEPLPHNISYIAINRIMAKTIFWNRAKHVLAPLIEKNGVNESDLSIQFKNGGRLKLWGSDVNPDSARGGYDSLQLFDEFPYHKPGIYEVVFRPKQSDTQAGAWFVGSPNGFNHGYGFWKRGHTEPDYKSWQYPSVAGGYITEAEVQAAKRDMSLNKWRQEYLAEFVGMEGRVILDWSYLNVDTEVRYQPDQKIYISCDFNVNPMCWALLHRVNGEYLYFDELAIPNTNVTKAALEIAHRYKDHKAGVIFTGDASGKNRSYLASTTAYPQAVETLRNAGIPNVGFDIPEANPLIQDRIDGFNRLVSDGNGSVRIRVNPITCPRIIFSLENARYLEGSSHIYEPSLKDITASPDMMYVVHMLDAVTYAPYRYDPPPKSVSNDKPKPRVRTTPFKASR